jgi:hypothetical protein
MGFPIETTNLKPAGHARYDGANAAILLTSAPSDVGAGGVAAPADPTTAGDMRTLRHVDFAATGGGLVLAADDGTAATATHGFPIDGESVRNGSRVDIVSRSIYIPAGTSLYVRYWWGAK